MIEIFILFYFKRVKKIIFAVEKCDTFFYALSDFSDFCLDKLQTWWDESSKIYFKMILNINWIKSIDIAIHNLQAQKWVYLMDLGIILKYIIIVRWHIAQL